MARRPAHREVIRERWLRGRLNYKLHAGQWKIRNAFDSCRKQLFVGECSRQFGKTIFEATLALEMAFRKPRSKTKIGTAFHTDLIEFILPAFDIVLDDCPDDLRPIWKSQQSKFVFPHNGSEIKLIGLDRKPNGLRGTVIDLIILSEAAFISNLHYLYKSVIIPATTHRPHCRVTMLSTPPETPAHDFLDYVQKAIVENAYIKLTVYDNPMLTAQDIERLMDEAGGEHSTTWKREYLCIHITDANLAIINEWDDKYIQEVPRAPYFMHLHKYVSMDLGVKDHTAVIYAYYDFIRTQLVIEDEFVVNGPDLTTRSLQGQIKNKELALWAPGKEILESNLEEEKKIDQINSMWERNQAKIYLRLSDNNNPLLLQDLSHMHNIHFLPTDKGRLEEMVNTLKMLVRSGGLIVHPRCVQTIGCLRFGVWDKRREKFARSKVFGHFDALAALIYLVRNLDRSTNPIPIDFQLDNNNQLLVNSKKESQSVKNIKNAFGL
jgi:Terminase large subunit, T4likevirus-type, N-terminal